MRRQAVESLQNVEAQLLLINLYSIRHPGTLREAETLLRDVVQRLSHAEADLTIYGLTISSILAFHGAVEDLQRLQQGFINRESDTAKLPERSSYRKEGLSLRTRSYAPTHAQVTAAPRQPTNTRTNPSNEHEPWLNEHEVWAQQDRRVPSASVTSSTQSQSTNSQITQISRSTSISLPARGKIAESRSSSVADGPPYPNESNDSEPPFGTSRNNKGQTNTPSSYASDQALIHALATQLRRALDAIPTARRRVTMSNSVLDPLLQAYTELAQLTQGHFRASADSAGYNARAFIVAHKM